MNTPSAGFQAFLKLVWVWVPSAGRMEGVPDSLRTALTSTHGTGTGCRNGPQARFPARVNKQIPIDFKGCGKKGRIGSEDRTLSGYYKAVKRTGFYGTAEAVPFVELVFEANA